MIAVGIIMLALSVDVANIIGAPLLTTRANDPWHMNNYFVVTVSQAYIYFSFLPLFLGGLFAGMAIPAFFSTSTVKKRMVLAAFFALAVGCLALGFNTFDYLLGCFYFPNNHPQPAFVDWMLVSFSMDVWNFYFFLFIVPLGASGVLLGFASVAKLFRFKNF
jgi:hypothetical protein